MRPNWKRRHSVKTDQGHWHSSSPKGYEILRPELCLSFRIFTKIENCLHNSYTAKNSLTIYRKIKIYGKTGGGAVWLPRVVPFTWEILRYA